MKRILLSLLILSATGALAFGVSRAFFSDEEKSVGNQFTAGAIDLKVDNTSYYNGFTADGKLELWNDATWTETDLTDHLFFDFADVKPGDLGEDTVSLKVLNNPAWVCADIDITANDDVTCTEPELVDDPTCDASQTKNGELADQLNFIFWADDGDNVLEENETVLTQGPAKDVLGGVTWALADSQNNIWGTTGPMEPNVTKNIGKAWCFGALAQKPIAQDPNNSPLIDPGVTCDGKDVNNAAQTDKLMGDIVFRAIQARHNENFVCERPVKPTPTPIRVESPPLSFGPMGWGGWSCPADTTVVGGGYEPAGATVQYSGPAKPGEPTPTLPPTPQCPSGVQYPCYPHYTYTPPETGWVVQNDNDGELITVYALCVPSSD